MMTLGMISLALACLVAAGAFTACVPAARFESQAALRIARGAMVAFAALIGVASYALLSAFLNNDFGVDYVAKYSEIALPTGYKVAAFWAGQQGSLLLWALVLAVMVLVVTVTQRKASIVEAAATLGVLAGVCAFFAALMLFVPDANPFTASPTQLTDGHGLNPMLQDPGMIAHPPILFMGYAAYTIPFAMLLGTLIAGRRDALWLAAARKWALLAWLFLTAGIILGAQWAYVELGWGGYWAWDPVENASLLPWLTGTALLHSIMAQQHRGMLKIWNAVLICLTFVLCIFGTYLTRSGVVASVHAFEGSAVATFFQVFLFLTIAVSTGVILWRLGQLRSDRPLEALTSKEGVFLLTNLLLVGIMLATLIGTMYPVLSGWFGESQSVNQTFYNKKVVPMSLVLVGLMALAPLFGYGRDAAARLVRKLAVPGAVGLFAILVMAVLGIGSIYALLCGAIVAAGIITIGWDLVRGVRERMAVQKENPATATLRLLDGSHRRYGGQIVHIGMLLIVAGVTGSSLFSVEKTLTLKPGQTEQLGAYQMTFKGLESVRGANFTAVQAIVDLRQADGTVKTLLPQRRKYDKWEQPASEVSIESSWREDLYVLIGGWDEASNTTAIKAIVNPLVSWIWTGGLVLLVGTVVCLLPRLEPRAWRVKEAEEIPFAKPLTKNRRQATVGA